MNMKPASTLKNQEKQDEDWQREMVVVNTGIWKKSKLSRAEFLKRIRCVKAIRVDEIRTTRVATGYPILSFVPLTLESWANFEKFHALVNTADFSIFDEHTERRFFAIVLPQKVGTWLHHAKFTTIQLQILNWLAALATWHGEMPEKKVPQLPSEIKKQIDAIRSEYYGNGFSFEEIWGKANSKKPFELLKHYENVSRSFTGAAPPEFLKIRDCELSQVDLKTWGLDRSAFDDWSRLNIPYRFAYFRDDDWERIVEKGVSDELLRSESSDEMWQKWLHTFELYPTRKSHLFNVLGTEVPMGFVYLFRGKESGHYKIGFTGGSEPYGRHGSLKTGSSEQLERAGHFRAASMKTETVVKNHFAAKRLRPDSEWFALSETDVANLLDEDWRIKNNIF
jgi:hypothetical protein